MYISLHFLNFDVKFLLQILKVFKFLNVNKIQTFPIYFNYSQILQIIIENYYF